MSLMKEIICPYCHSNSVSFKYSEVNAIYRADKNGYHVGLPEDTTNHYHCNNCCQEFMTDGAGRLTGDIQPENSYKIFTAPSFKQKTMKIQSIKVPVVQKDYIQGMVENSTDQKLDKIIDLLEKLIVKLN